MASLKKRNGTYYAQYYRDGKQVRRSLQTKNRRDAMRLLRELEDELRDAGHRAPPSTATVADLRGPYRDWLHLHRAPGTCEHYETVLDAWERIMGDLEVRSITPAHIEEFKTRRIAEGVGPRVINSTLVAVNALVNRAIRQGWYTGPNPFHRFEPLPESRKPPVWLAKDQIATALEVAEMHSPEAHMFWALGIYAGFRKMEICHAQWQWFDLDAQTIHLQKDLPHFDLKNHEERHLPLSIALLAVLDQYYQGQPGGYLLYPERGPERSRYRFHMKPLFRDVRIGAGLPATVTPHKLRHTFGAQLAQKGVPLHHIAKVMGHKDLTTTQIYAHLEPERIDVEF